MTWAFREKTYRHRFTRHSEEAYAPALAPDATTLAWLSVDRDRETLVLQREPSLPPVAVSAPGLIFEPVFAGEWLFWSERAPTAGGWRLRATRWRDPAAPAAAHLLERAGRPVHLAATTAPDGGAWVAWEERSGLRTRIQLTRLSGDGIFAPSVAPAPPGVNAYDPALARASDGSLWCAWSAYSDDQYRIFLAHLDSAGRLCGAPVRVSERSEPCVWPSLWPSARGGVWFSFTAFVIPATGKPDQNQPLSYVKHERYLRQRQFYGCHGLVHTGWCDGTQLWAPFAGPHSAEKQFFVAAGLAFGTEGAGHSQIIEDAAGGVHLILRHYAQADPSFNCENPPAALRVHPHFSPKQARQMHPNLSLASLGSSAWLPPRAIVPRAHFDLAINPGFDGRRLAVPFVQDVRLTGWSGGGEWFDDVGELGLGIARLEVEPLPFACDLSPLAIPPFPAGRMTNPASIPPATATWRGRVYALGQTHCHSSLSVCRRELDRDPHFNYRFMQDVQGCRFGLLTDHEYNLWHTEMLVLHKLSEYYDFPGEFVALHGYEWTGSDSHDCAHDGGPFGHVNVLGFEPLGPDDVHNPSEPFAPGNSLEKLWTVSAGRKCLTPPHHVVDLAHPYNWKFWSDKFEPFIEIFQDDRGSGEQADAPGLTNSTRLAKPIWAVDALRQGRRFGFVAGGDHSGVALGGVWIESFTREALHRALSERCCYATTGQHAAIMFTANDRPLGSTGAGAPADFRLIVGSVEPVVRVEVLRNGTVVRVFDDPNDSGRRIWSEPAATAGDFWYCRIHWQNGELAWTSPVWL